MLSELRLDQLSPMQRFQVLEKLRNISKFLTKDVREIMQDITRYGDQGGKVKQEMMDWADAANANAAIVDKFVSQFV